MTAERPCVGRPRVLPGRSRFWVHFIRVFCPPRRILSFAREFQFRLGGRLAQRTCEKSTSPHVNSRGVCIRESNIKR